ERAEAREVQRAVRAAEVWIVRVVRSGVFRAPAPDRHAEWRVARHLVSAVVATALRLEVVANEIDARELVASAGADRLPAGDVPEAGEVHGAKLAGRRLDAHDDEVRLRIRGIGEEHVSLQVLLGRYDVDRLGIAGAALGAEVVADDRTAASAHERTE